MDVFALRNKVVSDYRRYIESFVRIRDSRIDSYVRQEFDSGVLWPDSILQLNPAYEPGPTLDELARQSIILPDTARFFRKFDGSPLRLYKHQREAIEIARLGEPYVVTTGTGSGKSLTYLVPIYDHILRTEPHKHQVRAIIVYPMNALINSQLEALKAYAAMALDSPVRFDRYTGQERQAARDRILQDPPHILLTNYAMLEYMLLRPAERVFTEQATSHLEYLVLDELHTYRGRQGADVAMLLRRLRERSGNPKLLNIGTSATMATEGNRETRHRAVAAVAGKIFGASVKPENVIDETLRRAIQVASPEDRIALRAAAEAPVPLEFSEFIRSPFAAWVEEVFGLEEKESHLVRRKPITFQEGVRKLSAGADLPEETCSRKLQQLLSVGNSLRNEDGEPLFAFRLHQFLAAGGTVYSTLESPATRQLSLEGQYYAPGGDGSRLLYPLVFCRECGQEYYMVNWRKGVDGRVAPRTPIFYADDQDSELLPGYAALNEDSLWSEEREIDLPDHWWEYRAAGPRIKKDYKQHVPQRLLVAGDGAVLDKSGTGSQVWFQLSPFLLCLRCGVAYDRTEKNDFRKLTRLSHTGRSTATTLVSGSAIVQLRNDTAVREEARKLLSFTDNRQDASLQAGHFNDFIQVALVRAALFRALTESGTLDHATVTQAVFKALALREEFYALQPAGYGPGRDRNDLAMQRLLEYRLYEDLRRGWRIVQPNLEQCGLLRIEYPGLAELCSDESRWATHPVLREADPQDRAHAVYAFLDHLRREMAVDVRVLDPAEEWELRQRVQQNLRDPWAFDSDDPIRHSTLFVLPGGNGREGQRDRSLASNSRLGRFLRSRGTWRINTDIQTGDWEHFLSELVKILQGNYLRVTKTHTQQPAIQLLAGAMIWKLGDGNPPRPDPVRSKWMRSAQLEKAEREANKFFAELYRETARQMAGVEGGAHTGQIPSELREQREEMFRSGKLSALFCSPTMELGIDIRDLNVVHMRNIPPTPANYAQRSGRAGRSGQPALVAAFCSEGSPHDQYFFRQPQLMVAGAVAPPRLELGNEELVRAHVHSLWLASTGIALGNSMHEVLDLENPPGYPLAADVEHRTHIPEPKAVTLFQEGQRILDACGDELKRSAWYNPGWLAQVLKDAPSRFNAAFDRWRELYRSALMQKDEARRVVDRPRATQKERSQAEAAEREATREIALLLNQSDESTESDFYPYRYLAAEAFLPGYNFPRLPLRALLPVEDKVHIVDRPRFLGIGEFGPRNVLYHEGRKYRMSRCILPTGGAESRLRKAKFCMMCGYFHDEEHVSADSCNHCKSSLTGDTSEFVPRLFEMTTVRGARADRITCDEEERTREGYELVNYYRFSTATDGGPILDKASCGIGSGQELLSLTHAPQAELWRVNRKWRRSDQRGFNLDSKTGFWAKRPGDDDLTGDIEAARLITGVLPFVRDTRNLLLVKPFIAGPTSSEAFLASLAFALQRGMQILFQIEEQEIAVNRIGRNAERRILFWEAAEGGNGIWPRLFEEPSAMAQVARKALEICHFDPDTGEDKADLGQCSRACYRCLLSYSNQMDHPSLDRFSVRDYLLQLGGAATTRAAAGRSYDEQFLWLEQTRDPHSSLEGEFLKLLYDTRRRLPDRAQFRPDSGVYAEADFYYERDGLKGIAVFIDGPTHDEEAQKAKDQMERRKLDDLGFRVVVIRYDQRLEDQVRRYMDVFGPGLP